MALCVKSSQFMQCFGYTCYINMFILYFTKEDIKSAIKNLYYDSIWIPNFYLTSPKFPGDVDIVFLIVLLHLAGFMLLLICFKSRSGWFPKLSVWESLKCREHNPRSTNKHVAYLRCGWKTGTMQQKLHECSCPPDDECAHSSRDIQQNTSEIGLLQRFYDVVNQLQITICFMWKQNFNEKVY